MWRHPVIKVVLLVYVGWAPGIGTDRLLHPPDGILAAGEPQQTELTSGEKPRLVVDPDHARSLSVTARILSRERYHFDAWRI